MRKSTNNISSVLSSLSILMLVVVVVGFLFYRTDGFTTAYKQFYLVCGDDNIVGNRDNMPIKLNEEYRFDIVNKIAGLIDDDSNYVVKIVPKIDEKTNFTFIVDNEEKTYGDIESLTKCFELRLYTNYFILKATTDLPNMLQDLYSVDSVSNCPNIIDTATPYFTLIVMKGADEISINLSLESERL